MHAVINKHASGIFSIMWKFPTSIMVFKGVFNIRGKGLLLDNLRNNPIIIHNINIFFYILYRYGLFLDYYYYWIVLLPYYGLLDYLSIVLLL